MQRVKEYKRRLAMANFNVMEEKEDMEYDQKDMLVFMPRSRMELEARE